MGLSSMCFFHLSSVSISRLCNAAERLVKEKRGCRDEREPCLARESVSFMPIMPP